MKKGVYNRVIFGEVMPEDRGLARDSAMPKIEERRT